MVLAGAALNELRAMACACAPHGRVDLVVALLRCTKILLTEPSHGASIAIFNL